MAAGDGTALSGMSDREALAPLRAAARENLPALLGRHANKETVGLLAVPAVRLKCAYALGHDCKTSAGTWSKWRNLNSNEGTAKVSIAAQRIAMLSSVPRGLATTVSNRAVGAPPEVFHSCGKNCGKAQGRKSGNAL